MFIRLNKKHLSARKFDFEVTIGNSVFIFKGDDAIEADKTIREYVNITKNKKEMVKYGDYVYMTKEQREKLERRFGLAVVADKLEDLDIYIGKTGRKYKDHYLTLLGFLKRDGREQGRSSEFARL